MRRSATATRTADGTEDGAPPAPGGATLQAAAVRRDRARPWLSDPLAIARLAGAAIAVVLIAVGDIPMHPVTIGALVGYAIVLVPMPASSLTTVADLAVGTVLIATHGIAAGPFLFLTVTGAYGAGRRLGAVRGAAATLLLTAAQVHELVTLEGGAPPVGVLLTMLAVHPVAAILASLVVDLEQRQPAGRQVLVATHRVLDELNRYATALPGGLDTASVTAASVQEAITISGAPVAVLYAGSLGLLRPVAVHGDLVEPPLPLTDELVTELVGVAAATTVDTAALPPALRASCLDHPRWTLLPLRLDGRLVGALLLATDRDDANRRTRRELDELALDTALALDNARLFEEAQARAADTARRRIAHDLHDGVAQSLAHIRMELDLLSRLQLDPATVTTETAHLADVAARALDDVRATITGLRLPLAEDGLLAALRQHVDDMHGLGGPRISLEAAGAPDVPDDVAEEVLRIAQEALSNAVRHAQARHVIVALEGDAGELSLVVEDDGRGIPTQRLRRGVGLRAMRERAERIGADLTIRPRRGGGTVVALAYPRTRHRAGHRHVSSLASSPAGHHTPAHAPHTPTHARHETKVRP